MNRRYFLGIALSAAAAPTFARTTERPRLLSFHHMHTDESITVAYRIGDHYQRSALQKLNQFFRDFRTGDSIAMDPRLMDLLYDMKSYLGNSDACYQILSAYRSPQTNAMLRRTSRGVAKNSLHLTGQAVDIRLPDQSCCCIRDAALALRRGGVGYYRRSNFVHVDTGAVRRWSA
jgi:uncharacterized protein YcbK (DUF882 family)